MSFSRTSLATEIASRLKGGDGKSLTKSIAAYLIENGKTSELNSLERDITELRSSESGVVELSAISAHPLEQSQIDGIEQIVRKINPKCKRIIVNQTLDESVIGGIRLEFANQLLDLSASSKLSKLRQLTS